MSARTLSKERERERECNGVAFGLKKLKQCFLYKILLKRNSLPTFIEGQEIGFFTRICKSRVISKGGDLGKSMRVDFNRKRMLITAYVTNKPEISCIRACIICLRIVFYIFSFRALRHADVIFACVVRHGLIVVLLQHKEASPKGLRLSQLSHRDSPSLALSHSLLQTLVS